MKHEIIDGIPRPVIPVKDWGTQKMDLKDKGITAIVHITEVHHKADGAMDDKPSLAFVCSTRGLQVVAEISIYTLTAALDKLGYQVTPKT